MFLRNLNYYIWMINICEKEEFYFQLPPIWAHNRGRYLKSSTWPLTVFHGSRALALRRRKVVSFALKKAIFWDKKRNLDCVFQDCKWNVVLDLFRICISVQNLLINHTKVNMEACLFCLLMLSPTISHVRNWK